MKTNIKIILGMILILSMFPLTTAVECVGESCPVNMSLTVDFPPSVSQSVLTGQFIYGIMESSGAGLGTFMTYVGQAIPLLLIGLAFVGIFIIIGIEIAKAIQFQNGRGK